MSPYLFSRYIHELLGEVIQSRCDCCIGDMMLNVLAYADDLVLLAPSWRAMHYLLHLLNKLSTSIDMIYSTIERPYVWFSAKAALKNSD